MKKIVLKFYQSVVNERFDNPGYLKFFGPNDFEGLIEEKCQFTSAKGINLDAFFYYYPNYEVNRLIVFDHGMAVGHEAYFKEIEVLCKMGYKVFSYNHTGCSSSGGDSIDALSVSLSDLRQALKYLLNNGYQEEQISVIGHSWGGFSSGNILHFYPNLRNIVSISPFISVKDALRDKIPFPLKGLYKVGYRLEEEKYPEEAHTSMIDTLNNTKKKVLVIYGTNDEMLSYKKNFLKLKKKVTNSNIEFLSCPNKGHLVHYSYVANDYYNEVFDRFRSLIKTKKLQTLEEKKEYMDKVDWDKITEQDKDIWNKISDFLNK